MFIIDSLLPDETKKAARRPLFYIQLYPPGVKEWGDCACRYRLPLSPDACCRKLAISRSGGAPNKRLYSRLNWEGLS